MFNGEASATLAGEPPPPFWKVGVFVVVRTLLCAGALELVLDLVAGLELVGIALDNECFTSLEGPELSGLEFFFDGEKVENLGSSSSSELSRMITSDFELST